MKIINKKILKVLAAVVAIALIGCILFITNAFVGNPISSAFANKAIKEYVEENYSFLELETEKVRYNAKDGLYGAGIKSRTSIDTRFYVYYSNGEVVRDSYDVDVLHKVNTLDRLAQEYTLVVNNIISEKLSYKVKNIFVFYRKEYYGDDKGLLKLDMKFDKNSPLDAEVTLSFDLQDSSVDSLAKVLIDVHKTFLENGCKFTSYNLDVENKEVAASVMNVKPEDIESGELVELLEKAASGEEANGIIAFTKGEKK